MKNITKPDICSTDTNSVRQDGYNNVNLAELLALSINMWLCISATEPKEDYNAREQSSFPTTHHPLWKSYIHMHAAAGHIHMKIIT